MGFCWCLLVTSLVKMKYASRLYEHNQFILVPLSPSYCPQKGLVNLSRPDCWSCILLCYILLLTFMGHFWRTSRSGRKCSVILIVMASWFSMNLLIAYFDGMLRLYIQSSESLYKTFSSSNCWVRVIALRLYLHFLWEVLLTYHFSLWCAYCILELNMVGHLEGEQGDTM